MSPPLTPEQFQRVKAVYLDLADLPPAEAQAKLAQACGGDEGVRGEVQKLLGITGDDTMLGRVNSQVDKLLLGDRPSTTATQWVGQTVGPYQVTGLLGQGGMGVVYAARDTRLDRTAALKAVLPGEDDPKERLYRLRREARLLASLSHPNLAVVYGLEEANGTLFLAMELVEGQTLSQKLGRQGLPMAEALRCCAAIADGVAQAHDAGVIHRDLKPGNVVVTPDGVPKVLDFGLAREVRLPGETLHDESHQATLTRQGSFFGTPAYMSPEQVRGETLDARTDIFSFGAILFRCLTGKPAFEGETDAEVVSAILHSDPEWSYLPANTPEIVQQVLKRCLAKDRSNRFRHIGDVKLDLVDALAKTAWETKRRTPGRRSRLIPVTLGLLACAITLGIGLTWSNEPRLPSNIIPSQSHRFDAALPAGTRHSDLERLQLALSPTGGDMLVACNSPGGNGIWRWSHADGQWHFIDKTENGHRPTVSPDGEWVGFFRDDHYYKQRLTGRGEPLRITDISNWYGAAWADDGTLITAPAWAAGLQTLGSDGELKQLSKLNSDVKEFAHFSPHAVAGTRWVLFGVWTGGESCAIHAVHLDTRQQHLVIANAGTPRFAKTPRGDYLLFERSSIIFAAPFDAKTATLAGQETAIAEGVMNDGTRFAAYYDVAADGTLAYIAGASFSEENRLSYVNADRTSEPLNDDRLSFAEPMFSANGETLSTTIKGKLYRLLVYDLKRHTKEYLLVGGDAVAHTPSPDGRTVAVSVSRDGGYALELFTLSNGAMLRRLVPPGADYQSDLSWSTDGKYLTFTMAEREGVPRDVWIVNADGQSPPRQLVASNAADMHAAISPDGKWVAYTSETSGRREIYLVTCPDGTSRRQVSFDGGESPAWSPDGRQLYFVRDRKLVRVELNADGIILSRPTVIYDKPFGQSDTVARNYIIAPDGRPVIVEPSENRKPVDHISIMTNWSARLNRTP